MQDSPRNDYEKWDEDPKAIRFLVKSLSDGKVYKVKAYSERGCRRRALDENCGIGSSGGAIGQIKILSRSNKEDLILENCSFGDHLQTRDHRDAIFLYSDNRICHVVSNEQVAYEDGTWKDIVEEYCVYLNGRRFHSTGTHPDDIVKVL